MENNSLKTNTNEIIINFNHNSKLNLKEDSTLNDLMNFINNKFLLKENEYSLFIKDVQLLSSNKDLQINTLVQTYNNLIANQDIFDLKQQLIECNDFIELQIKTRENAIISMVDDYQSLIKSLES